MENDGKRRVGRALTFVVSGALLVAGPLGCGGSETTTNEVPPDHTNEPADTGGGETAPTDGTGETGPTESPPDEPHTNEPAPE